MPVDVYAINVLSADVVQKLEAARQEAEAKRLSDERVAAERRLIDERVAEEARQRERQRDLERQRMEAIAAEERRQEETRRQRDEEAARIRELPFPEDAEKSTNRSGWAGVYPNGQGWKAMWNGINLGTWPTLVEAVIARTDAKRDAEAEQRARVRASEELFEELPVPPQMSPSEAIIGHARGGKRPELKPRRPQPNPVKTCGKCGGPVGEGQDCASCYADEED